MSVLILAFLLGWFTLTVPVSAETEEGASKAIAEKSVEKTEDESFEFPGFTDEDWRKRLLAVKQGDRWSVGAEIGMDLVRIPGDRPYKILAAYWNQIEPSARKQILKGFTPGMMGNKGIHERFFDVMHLGMMDKNPGVRSFAAGYIEMQGLPNFEHDAKGYRRWRKETEGLTAKEISKNEKQGISLPKLNFFRKAPPKVEWAFSPEGKNGVAEPASTAKDDFKRAWQMFFKQKYSTSERLFRRVLETELENPHAMNGLGWSLRNQGKFTEAKPLLQQAIKLAPDHWGAISGLASCYHDEGNVEEAVKLWERVAENAEGANDATVSLAEIYLERGQYEKSVECYEKLVVWFPEQKAFTELLSKAKEGLAKKTK